MSQAAGLAPACATSLVSTVNQAWGRVTWTNAMGCPHGDGYFLLHREPGWVVDRQGAFDNPPCPALVLPTRVGKDLRICRSPRTHVLCWPGGSSPERELRQHPSRCNSLGPGDDFAGAVNLVRLRWHGWGKEIARARGIERGFHVPFSRIPVRVRAFRRVACASGDIIYTRLRATSRDGSTGVRFPKRCSD